MLEIADPVFGQMRYDYRWGKKKHLFFWQKADSKNMCESLQ